MNLSFHHITVCICTYKRPELLTNLLSSLEYQNTNNLFTYSVVVVDNDSAESAKSTIEAYSIKSHMGIHYYVEPIKNIALARNRAVRNSKGKLIAFIDDDESPINDWLLHLYRTYRRYRANGILGPVKPHFNDEPPKWIIKGKIFERKSFDTGIVIKNYRDTRTGNVLLSKDLFNNKKNYFNPDFGRTGGEDVDFFKRMIYKGYIFLWCNEAVVYETVSADRWRKSYLLKRSLLQGKMGIRMQSTSEKTIGIIKSLFAFVIYTLTLPFLFFFGNHVFMKYMIKYFYHIGKLAALCGLSIIKERDD